MERPNFEQRQVRPVLLPTICEYREFHREEDYQKTPFTSKLFKTRRRTRNGYTKLTQRFEDEEGPEEEQPLLSIYTQANEESKPKRASGWKMRKKEVKIAWPRSPRRALVRSTAKALSPVFLLRTMRDVYVRALNIVGGKLNHRAWYSVGARAM